MSTNERSRLQLELRWMDEAHPEGWWRKSSARRLVEARIADMIRLEDDIANLREAEEEAHEAWMRASRLGSDDPAARERCLQARYKLIELIRKRDGRAA